MKIEEIAINGIRGFNFFKDDSGEPLPHLIKLEGKHLFLYGENGTGKSSLFDSIEWCLTNEIQECSNRNIKIMDYAKNLFCSEDDNPFVKITFNNSNFQRVLRGKNSPFEFADNARVCLIESSRIENFVIDNKSNLWQRFSDLLGFEALIKFDKQLSRLISESKKDISSIIDVLASDKSKLSEIEQEIWGLESVFYERLGNEWKYTIALKKGEADSVRYEMLNELVKTVNEFIDNFEKLKSLREEIAKKEVLLSTEKEKSSLSEISSIINETYLYFCKIKSADYCPVCGNQIEFDTTYERIKHLRSNFINILDLSEAISKISEEISKLEKSLGISAKKIIYYHNESFEEKIGDSIAGANLFRVLSREKEDIKQEKEIIGKRLDLSEKIGQYKEKKSNIQNLSLRIKTNDEELRIREKINEDICAYYDQYVKRYSDSIREELGMISRKEVSEIYNKINTSDEELIDEFIIEPNIDDKNIEFLAKLSGIDRKVKALEVLSTGHLRCLGFALLIARIKVRSDKLKFIVIDDPIYSIDHDHRYNLIHYLMDLGESYQLIITSSDRLFFEILENTFNKNKFISYKTVFTKENGTMNRSFKLKESQYIDEAKRHLVTKDFRASSLYARLSLETLLFNIAQKLNLDVPIKRIKKLTIKDLIDSKIKDELKSKNPGKESEIELEFNKLNVHRYFKSLFKGFPLDHEVHHPDEDRNTYSQREVEEVIQSVEEFYDFINHLPYFNQ